MCSQFKALAFSNTSKTTMNSREVHQEKIRAIPRFDLNAPPSDERVDALMQAYLRRLRLSLPKHRRAAGRAPGAAVMVRKGNELIHLKGYGCANLETGEKITHETVFDLGSVSKQFTAFAALSIFSASDLDTPISKFFRGFPRYAEKITIKHLIHHTSALPDYIDLHVAARLSAEDWYHRVMSRRDDWYPQMSRRKRSKEVTNREVLRLVALQRLLPRKPDVDFEYSNTGYVLLAEIVRRATKQRLSQVLRERVFSVVGMDDTYVFDEKSRFRKQAPEVLHHARCYNVVKDKGFVPVGYSPMNFVYGDGNVHSTIVDMAKWDRYLTRLDRRTIFKSHASGEKAGVNARSILWEPAKLLHQKQAEYGAGWNLLRNKYKDNVRENGKKVMRSFASRAEYHRGVWLGWQNYIARAQKWILPAEGERVDPETWESMGIIVLTNNTVPAAHDEFYPCALAQQIAQLYWGHFKEDNIINCVNCEL
jgi:CubicO group peptidase (beta-lactamase class C family)